MLLFLLSPVNSAHHEVAMSSPNLLNRLTFRQLQVFQAVHRQRSYSRAAEQLGLTQPAVSAQIRQLELALGQPLFRYAGKTLHTLPAADTSPTRQGNFWATVTPANEPIRY